MPAKRAAHRGAAPTAATWYARLVRYARSPVHQRRAGQAAADALALAAALVLASLLRHDGRFAEANLEGVGYLTLPTMAVLLGIGSQFGLYNGRWRYGSFEEGWALARTIGLTTVAVLVIDTLVGRQAPRSAIIASGIIAMVFTASVRYGVRLLPSSGCGPRPSGPTG